MNWAYAFPFSAAHVHNRTASSIFVATPWPRRRSFPASPLTQHLPERRLADIIRPLLYNPLSRLGRIRIFDRERAALPLLLPQRRAEKDAPLPGCSSEAVPKIPLQSRFPLASGPAPRKRLIRKQEFGHSHHSQETKQGIVRKRLSAVGAYCDTRFGAGGVETSTFSVTMTRCVENSTRDQTNRNFGWPWGRAARNGHGGELIKSAKARIHSSYGR